tara:strand:- start:151 stop:492 length:342 start_codon:yes stop_codon:yes gene_type:complete
MPTLPKTKKRSWIKTMPKQLRQHDNSAFYVSKAWRNIRKFYIKLNPLCEQCKRNKSPQITPAKVVDHVKPIRLGGLRYDISNLQSLCDKCHNKKNQQESIEYRKGIKNYVRKR